MQLAYGVFIWLMMSSVQGIHVSGKSAQKRSIYDTIKGIENSYIRTHQEKNDKLLTSYLLSMHTQRTSEAREREIALQKEEIREKANERKSSIYRKHLANQVKGSSILRDFITLRY